MKQPFGTIKTTCLISEAVIQRRLRELAPDVRAYLEAAEGRRLMVGLMSGGMISMVWLSRYIGPCAEMSYADTSRYSNGVQTTFQWNHSPLMGEDVHGATVLICDDVADECHTLDFAIRQFYAWGAAQVKTFVLTSKPSKHKFNVTLDYVGFEVGDYWLGGAGMDLDDTPEGQFARLLPYVCCRGSLKRGTQKYVIPNRRSV